MKQVEKTNREERQPLAASAAAVAALVGHSRAAAETQALIEAERAEAASRAPLRPAGDATARERVTAHVAALQAAVTDQPDASGWSPQRDALLLDMRRKGVGWAAISIPDGKGGHITERRCQKRFAMLNAAGGGVRSALASVTPEATERDGIEWLSRKGRLTGARKGAALHFRQALRDAGGAMIKSSLNIVEGGASSGGSSDARLVGTADGKRELFVLRWVVLGGQTDLLTVMDGVCGAGHTLRQLAGEGSDDQVKARAKILEALLMVALDLVARHLEARDGAASQAA